MNRKSKNRIWEYFEIVFSIGVVISAILLVLDWKTYEVCFVIAFGLAAVLFVVRGIRYLTQARGRIVAGVLCFLAATLMVGFLVGSALTMWRGVE